MGLQDRRSAPEDLTRAAIAKGLTDPGGGLKQPVSEADAKSINEISRSELLEALAENAKINLWPRLEAHANLTFYGFGQKLAQLGALASPDGGDLTTDESAVFFHGLHHDDNLTALGDGLRALLDEQRGQPMAGILLITDGANNTARRRSRRPRLPSRTVCRSSFTAWASPRRRISWWPSSRRRRSPT